MPFGATQGFFSYSITVGEKTKTSRRTALVLRTVPMPFTEGEDVIDDGDDVMDEGANEGNEIIEEDEEQGENYWMKEATKSDRDGGSAGLDGEPLRAS